MNLPTLRRLTLSLVSGDNPRLTLETYFAVTSNTAQFGARLELYAAAWKFNAYGFLSFDVLFQFNPFYFIAEVTAMLALRVGSSSIASINLTLDARRADAVEGQGRCAAEAVLVPHRQDPLQQDVRRDAQHHAAGSRGAAAGEAGARGARQLGGGEAARSGIGSRACGSCRSAADRCACIRSAPSRSARRWCRSTSRSSGSARSAPPMRAPSRSAR